MRIVVDDSAAFNQGAGIGRYARQVVPAAARFLADPVFRLLYAPVRPGPAPFAAQVRAAFPDRSRVSVHRAPLSRRRIDQLWYRARIPMPVQLFAGGADVVYCPDFTAPPAAGVPRVMTVHDLAFEICPEHAPAALRAYLGQVVPRQVLAAARVVAVSETTKRDLEERLGVAPERIAVVPNGVAERFLEARPLSSAERGALGVPETYLLIVATLEPRKNHVALFRALRALEGTVDLPLVVAGGRGWEVEPILEAAGGLIRAGRVILLDYVSERWLPGLYAGAAVFVYPSWYEGFGLPVLEALAAGTAVVASTAPALREVGGDLPLYADPARSDELAGAIVSALGPERQSQDHRDRRRERARQFSWLRAGRALADVLTAVVDRRADARDEGGPSAWRVSGRRSRTTDRTEHRPG